MREGTLKELNVKVGDKVRPISNGRGFAVEQGRLLVITLVDHNYSFYKGKKVSHPKDHPWPLSSLLTFRLEEEAVSDEIKVGDEVEVCYTKDGDWWADGHIVSAIVGDYYILTVGKVAPIVAHESTVRKLKPKPVVKRLSADDSAVVS